MLIKICGITNAADARYALRTGADWVGLNLVAGPRRIDVAQAQRILSPLDDPSRVVMLVGVEPQGLLQRHVVLARRFGVRRLQLYGEVTPSVLRRIAEEGWESILVHHVGDESSWPTLDRVLSSCDAARHTFVLLDTAVGGMLGGTGQVANWNAIRTYLDEAAGDTRSVLLLAGGLTPDNVAEAIRTVSPAGVDVSSGVELEPGRKDHARIDAFIQAVRQVEG